MRRRQNSEATSADSTPAPPTLACRDCGVAVVIDLFAPVETLTSMGRGLMIGGISRPVEIKMSVCESCRKRQSRAAAMLDAHPNVSSSLGSRSYALQMVDSALIVFDVLGMSWSSVVNASDDRQLRRLLEHMPQAGAVARWSGWFVPTIRHGVEPGQIASTRERWAHVLPEQLQILRDTYAGFLRVLTDKPGPVPPPQGDGHYEAVRGCLLCGVGTIDALSIRAREAWGPLRSAEASTLGGRGRPEAIRGYLCPTCSKATDAAGGALGANAMERALFDHLKVQVKAHGGGPGEYGQEFPRIVGLRAWCVLSEGTAPNAKPWAHVSGLDDLVEGLRKL